MRKMSVKLVKDGSSSHFTGLNTTRTVDFWQIIKSWWRKWRIF